MSLDIGKKDEGSERIKITYHTPYGDFTSLEDAAICIDANIHLEKTGELIYPSPRVTNKYELLMNCRKKVGMYSQTVEGIPPLNVEALVRRYGSNRVSTGSLVSAKKAFVKGYTSDIEALKSLLNKGLDIDKEV